MKVWKAAAVAGLAGVLLTTGASAAPPRTGGLTADVIDGYVRDYAERTGLPGAVVAVTEGDRVVHVAGYGRTAGGEPITATTPVPLASLSKSFTALAVLRLADQGKLDLDAPVRRYLPEFVMADDRAGRITVRQLLQHTSGMSDRAFPELTLPAPDTLREAVAMLRDAPLDADPGTRMAYHNPNYAVAARLAEVVAGKPFADHLADSVLRPLGMTATRTVGTTARLPGAGAGYVRAYGGVIRREHPKWFLNGAFGVVSTGNDLARWLIAQSDAPDQAVKTTQAASGVGGSVYGMGWQTGETPGGAVRLRHTGWLLTHNAAQTVLPATGHGIAVVTNTGMVSGDDALIISDGLIDLLEGRDAGAEPFTVTADLWLAVLTLFNVGLGVLGVLRARAWARRRTVRRSLVRLIPYVLPVAFFLGLADVAGAVMNRAGTLAQMTYVWPALFAWAASAALAAAAVVVARLLRLLPRLLPRLLLRLRGARRSGVV